MLSKVVIETSVLIGASVTASSRLFGIEIKDQHYDISSKLFEVIKKNIRKRVGIFTRTVETEARNTISWVILKRVKEKLPERSIEEAYEIHYALFSSCQDLLNENISFLVREPIDEKAVDMILPNVDMMYKELSKKAEELRLQRKEETKVLRGSLKGFKFRLRSAVKEARMHTIQERKREYLQAERLLRSPAEDNDKRIIAECAYLLGIYREEFGKKFTLYLASADQHIAPHKRSDSTVVSENIEKRFGIIADWPDEIAVKL